MLVQGAGFTSLSSSLGVKLWDAETPDFSDFIDLINPLQHIPVVSNLYQQETGDTMGAVAKIAGAAVLGGPIGGAIALANEVVEAVTGNSVTGHLLGLAGVEKPNPNNKTEVVIQASQEEVVDLPRRRTTNDWIYGHLQA